MQKLPFEIGQIYDRQADVHSVYGGNRRAGIAACGRYPLIFLFSAPSGKSFGYEDGWIADDEFFYTGEGQRGDKDLARGNRAIYEHQHNGKQLHLFRAQEPGAYEYLGRFEYANHTFRKGRDKAKNARRIIVFRLKRL